MVVLHIGTNNIEVDAADQAGAGIVQVVEAVLLVCKTVSILVCLVEAFPSRISIISIIAHIKRFANIFFLYHAKKRMMLDEKDEKVLLPRSSIFQSKQAI